VGEWSAARPTRPIHLLGRGWWWTKLKSAASSEPEKAGSARSRLTPRQRCQERRPAGGSTSIREIQTPLNAYLYALSTRDRRPSGEVNADQNQLTENQIRTAEDGLINLGMSQAQIREVARTRTATTLMQVRAPEAGVILARNISRGLAHRRRSLELYRIADIGHVWVLADLHGAEANLVPLGAAARVRVEGHVLPARISTSCRCSMPPPAP